jgi:hypothetical protein
VTIAGCSARCNPRADARRYEQIFGRETVLKGSGHYCNVHPAWQGPSARPGAGMRSSNRVSPAAAGMLNAAIGRSLA